MEFLMPDQRMHPDPESAIADETSARTDLHRRRASACEGIFLSSPLGADIDSLSPSTIDINTLRRGPGR
jgi:hypothetical protein